MATSIVHSPEDEATQAERKEARSRWLALESNPEVLDSFSHDCGLPENFAYRDIFGLDAELLAFIPQPCIAVILLRPSGDHDETAAPMENYDGIFYLTQIKELGNACGTVAMIHAITNNAEKLGLSDDNALVKFVNDTQEKSPLERGQALEANEEIRAIHNSKAEEGQTEVIDGKVQHHFVCFTEINGELVELDGCADGPISHGAFEDGEDTLSASARVIKEKYMTGDNLDFSMIALCDVSNE